MADVSPIDMQKALKGVEYPTSRKDLVTTARNNGADDTVVRKLEHLSKDRFDGPDQVSKEMFGH
jgi:hypothetical protein